MTTAALISPCSPMAAEGGGGDDHNSAVREDLAPLEDRVLLDEKSVQTLIPRCQGHRGGSHQRHPNHERGGSPVTFAPVWVRDQGWLVSRAIASVLQRDGLKRRPAAVTKPQFRVGRVTHYVLEGRPKLLAIAGTGYGLIGILVIILLIVLIFYFLRRA